MNSNDEIREVIFNNYNDLRDELLYKYNVYTSLKKEYDGIFHIDIDKQYMDIVREAVTEFIVKRSVNIGLMDIKLYVEDYFTFDNVERIISEDGNV